MNQDSLTSNARKLLYHADRLLSVRFGIARPVVLFISITNRCQLDCKYCLYADEDTRLELSLEQVTDALDICKTLDIRAVELTGGGEPLLHPDFDAIMEEARSREIAVGLMTNGLGLSRVKLIESLQWVRVSLHAFGTQRQPLLLENIAAVRKRARKLTASFVATRERMDDISRLLKWSAAAAIPVKIEPDWFGPWDEAQRIRAELTPILVGHPFAFLDKTIPSKEIGPCWMHVVKPFLYTDGWVYPCPCPVGPSRSMDSGFRLCRMEDMIDYFRGDACKSLQPGCGWCKYRELNEAAEAVVVPLEDKEFC